MKKIYSIILVFVLTITLVGTVEGSYAATYTELPAGKNYIDQANVNNTYSSIGIIDIITVKANTDYVISVPWNSNVADYVRNCEPENLPVHSIKMGAKIQIAFI